jgi:hypothetical protein
MNEYDRLTVLIIAFVNSLTETEGHVVGEWPEYEALLVELGWNT